MDQKDLDDRSHDIDKSEIQKKGNFKCMLIL